VIRSASVAIVMAILTAGCGNTRTVTVTTTVNPVPKSGLAYVDPLGVHLPVSLAQLHTINRFITSSDRMARGAPDVAAPVASVEVTHRWDQRPGWIRVIYHFYCTAADDGYEVDVLSPQGISNLVETAPSIDTTTGDVLCYRHP
jgi:hypothetical protein